MKNYFENIDPVANKKAREMVDEAEKPRNILLNAVKSNDYETVEKNLNTENELFHESFIKELIYTALVDENPKIALFLLRKNPNIDANSVIKQNQEQSITGKARNKKALNTLKILEMINNPSNAKRYNLLKELSLRKGIPKELTDEIVKTQIEVEKKEINKPKK